MKNTNKSINIKIVTAFILGVLISITSSYALAETLIKSADVSYVDNAKLGATTVQGAIDGTCTKFSNDLATILDKMYPIGSIYISTTLSTPSQVASAIGGTWTSYGVGKTLLSSTTSEQTGGSNTVTLKETNLPAHTHTYDKANANTGSHILTIDEMPSHTHIQDPHVHEVGAPQNGSGEFEGWAPNVMAIRVSNSNALETSLTTAVNQYTGGSKGHTHSISTTSTNTGSAGSVNPTAINIQNPYITVYMYKRTK